MIVTAAICNICGAVYAHASIAEKNVVFDTNNDFGIGPSRATIVDSATRETIDICDPCRGAIQTTINSRREARCKAENIPVFRE